MSVFVGHCPYKLMTPFNSTVTLIDTLLTCCCLFTFVHASVHTLLILTPPHHCLVRFTNFITALVSTELSAATTTTSCVQIQMGAVADIHLWNLRAKCFLTDEILLQHCWTLG